MAKKIGARERIMQIAGKLFACRGYSAVGINEIIDKSGTAKASFYHHFPTKESLCEAWLADVHDHSEQRRNAILESKMDTVSKVRGYFDDLRKYLEESQFRGCPYSNTATVASEEEKKICRQVECHKLCQREFFRRLAGEITPSGIRAREIGDALFLLYSGATSEAQNLKAVWPVEAASRTAIEICEREKA